MKEKSDKKGDLSDENKPSRRVPQATVLRYNRFVLNINDIVSALKTCTIQEIIHTFTEEMLNLLRC